MKGHRLRCSVIAGICSIALSLASGIGVTATAVDQDLSANARASEVEWTADQASSFVLARDAVQTVVPSRNDDALHFLSREGETNVEVSRGSVRLAPLSTGAEGEFSLTLSEQTQDENAIVLNDGSSVLFGAASDHIVDSHDDGSVRLQTVLRSPEASHRISYELSLNEEERALIEPDGSIGIYRAFVGEKEWVLTSLIEAPWAVDARGTHVPTHFTLSGSQLTQVVAPDSTTVYPIVADPFWIPAIVAGLRAGVHIILKLGPRVVKYGVAPASRVTNALRSFSTLTFRAGSTVVRLDKSQMKHILQRHHPQYWSGGARNQQTFFNPKMSVADVRNLVHGALRNHATSIRSLGSRTGTYRGTYAGVKYHLKVQNGRVVQFYPL